MIYFSFLIRWTFSHSSCVFSAFLMYLIGVTSIYILSAASLARFYAVYNPLNVTIFSLKKCLSMIGGCFISGLFWSSMPLLGWSHYSLEGAGTICSVAWNERSWTVTSYNASICVFVFLIPLLCIIWTNTKLFIMV
jgi:c-opsin